MLPKLLSSLCMRDRGPSSKPVIIWCSNNQPNIHLVVEEMQHALSSWLDLDRMLKLHGYLTDDSSVEPIPPPPFMVFVNRRKESEEGCEHEWNNGLNHYLKTEVVWFHSGMSPCFRADKIENIKKGRIWGILCTDAAGMVSIKS
jgi:superfamily II DNA/RNA helicase